MEWNSTFKERFTELIGDETYRTVGDKLGISKTTVGAYVKGTREPKRPVLMSIARTYNVDPVWLLGGDTPKYSLFANLPDNILPPPEVTKVPRLGTIACGTPILADQNIECYDNVPFGVHCDFTLRCKGDSMIGARIFDGDLVCIRLQPEVESGEIAAVMVDSEEATLKRVKLFDDHIILEPENPTYRPLAFWDEDMSRVRILGKATHFISEVR